MDTRKHVLDLEAFREMLHISPRIPSQSFAELPFKEEILDILSLIISQAQILWGLYHGSNVDNAYLIWEDFVYQVEHKSQKKSNEMYYPRFTKVVIDYFITRKPSIPRRNRVNWHYVRDDVLFTTIKVKETSGSASSTTPPTPISTPTPTTTVVAAPRLSAAAKGKQPVRATTPTEPTDVERTEAEQLKIVLKRSRQETHISQKHGSSTNEGTGSRPGVSDVPSDDSEEELSWNSSDDEDVDEKTKGREESEGDKTNESDDDDDKEENTKISKQKSDAQQESSSTSSFMTNLLNPITDPGLESLFTTGSTTALVEAYDADKTILDNYGESTILKRRREDDDQEGPSAGSDQGSKRQREEGEHALASTPSEPATVSAGRTTIGSQSRQLSASESAFAKEPVQPTCQMEEPSHPVSKTGADDQPIVQTSQHPEWFSQPSRPPTPDRDWNKYLDWVNPEGQQYPHNLLQPLPLIPDNRGHSVIPFEHFINNDL
nr:hypothetical protein [Tanacetum cinerariifolium]